jgi:hypothetical protein
MNQNPPLLNLTTEEMHMVQGLTGLAADPNSDVSQILNIIHGLDTRLTELQQHIQNSPPSS